MMRHIAWILLLGGASAAYAQVPPKQPAARPTPAVAPESADEEEITVTGQKPPGSVVGDIPPEVTIGPAEIRSYGVSSITDLLSELAPQTGSVRGRGGEQPVVLLNGKRISSFAEIRDIPTEAIIRVDILPEEVALKYGYTADQKVVNFVLRRRFRAITVEGQGGTSTEGGGTSGKGEVDLLRIQGNGRLNVDVNYTSSVRLLESQRDILPSASGRPYDFAGNIAPAIGATQIDPRLSALAGQAVGIAGVPASAATSLPTLAQFAQTAGVANVSDVTPYRTLRPASDALSINATLNRTIFGNVSATINGTFGATGSEGLRGLPGATFALPAVNPFSPFATPVTLYRYLGGILPLTQNTAAETEHLGATLNGSLGTWQLNFTGNYDRSDTRTRTLTGIEVSGIQSLLSAGSLNPFGVLPSDLVSFLPADRAHAISNAGDVQLVASGTLFHEPAGNVSTTLKIGGEALGFDTNSVRSGITRSANLTRRNGNVQLNVDVPLTSRRNDVLAAIGDLSVNFNGVAQRYSDFGTLTTYGYGVTWKPRPKLSLIFSVTDEEGVPTVQQLGNPQIVTPAVSVYDYTLGRTVSVAQIDGGNPALRADDRHVTKLGLTWTPFTSTDLTVIANYAKSRTRNAIATLPALTSAIEAAFPDRFIRGSDGALASVDNRPVNFAREDREQLRMGITFSKPLKTSQALVDAFRALRAAGVNPFGRQGAPGGRDGARQPGGGGDGAAGPGGGGQGGPGGPGGGAGAGGGRGGFGGGGAGGRGGGGGRLQFALYHTWTFQDTILIRPGVPVLDLLDGSASGSSGGQPRHTIEAQAGYANNGLGARLSGNYQTGTTVRAGTTEASDLTFSSLLTANLRLFANVGQMPQFIKYPWARGLRVTLSFNNLTDQRIRVRDSTGATPLSYQPGYLDPLGREVRLSIRKLLF